MKKLIIGFLLVVLFLTGCTTNSEDNNNTSTTDTPSKTVKASDNLMDDIATEIKTVFE